MGDVAILLHGYGEHVYRPQYNTLTQFLEEECGWEVERHVIEGHWNPRSDAKPTFYFNDFRKLIEAVFAQIREIKARDGNEHVRVVLVGKSLGGLIAIRCLQELPPDLETNVFGAITIAAPIALGPKYDTPLKRALAYFFVEWLGWTWLYTPFVQFEPGDISKKHETEYQPDPNILTTYVWASVAVCTRNETFALRDKTTSVRKRLLILHGIEDTVCDCGASEQFAAQSEFIEMETYPDTAHDLLDEDESVVRKIQDRISKFLREIIPSNED